jgi:hypothetical protein
MSACGRRHAIGHPVDGPAIPFSPLGTAVGLVPLPLSYFPVLVATLLSYCVLMQLVKVWYIRPFSMWLQDGDHAPAADRRQLPFRPYRRPHTVTKVGARLSLQNAAA